MRCVVITADESSQTCIIGIFEKYILAILLDWPTVTRVQGVQYRVYSTVQCSTVQYSTVQGK